MTKKNRPRSLARREGNRYKIPMKDVLEKRNLEIVELLASGKSSREVGSIKHLTKSRIQEIAKDNHFDLSQRRSDFKRRRLIESGQLGKLPDVEIAKRFGVTDATVAAARRHEHIKKFRKPIGCDECKTHPYAKGLCKKCHSRYLYWRNK